jgi:hypothetical protein
VVGALRVRQQYRGDNDAAGKALLGGWRPRFVDFAVFAEAACKAMGFEPGAFTEAYKNNQGYALRYFAEHNAVCVGIVGLIAAQGKFRGYPEQLHSAMKPHTYRCNERLVGSAAWLMREALPRAAPALLKVYGIRVRTNVWIDNNGNNNGIEIERVEQLVGTGTYSGPTDIAVAPPPSQEKSGEQGQIRGSEIPTSTYQLNRAENKPETKPGKMRR